MAFPVPDYGNHLRVLNEENWTDHVRDMYIHMLNNDIESPDPKVNRRLNLLRVQAGQLFYLNRPVVTRDEAEELLQEKYREGLHSRDVLWNSLKQEYIGISRRFVDRWLGHKEEKQIMKKRPGKKTGGIQHSILLDVSQPRARYQVDMIDLQKIRRANSNFSYILVCIDCFSRYVECRPLKKRDMSEVVEAMESILESMGPPRNIIQADNEFRANEFQQLVDDWNLKSIFSSAYNPRSQGIVERFNGTLKRRLFASMAVRGNKRWVDILPTILESYNNTVHRVTKNRPSVVFNSNPFDPIRQEVNENNRQSVLPLIERNREMYSFLNPGDRVRILLQTLSSKERKNLLFKKSTSSVWTRDLFTVKRQTVNKGLVYIEELPGRSFLRKDIQFVDEERLQRDEVEVPEVDDDDPYQEYVANHVPRIEEDVDRNPLGLIVGTMIEIQPGPGNRWYRCQVGNYLVNSRKYNLKFAGNKRRAYDLTSDDAVAWRMI